MPFKSEKQRRFMYAAANNPDAKKEMGISAESAKRFIQHSKRETGQRVKGKDRNRGTSHGENY